MPAFFPGSSPHIRGVAWMVTSIGCFTASMVIVRGLHDEIPIFEIVFFRALAGVAVMLPWLGRIGVAGLIGAMVLIRPGFETVNLGALLALMAAMLTALLFNIAKLLTRTEPPDAVAFYQTFLMLPIAAIPGILVWVTPTWEQLFWLFAMGGLATLSHRTMNRAYVLVDLTVLQPLEFVRLPMAALLGLLAFGEWPDAWVWAGGAVIFAGSIYGTARKGKACRDST